MSRPPHCQSKSSGGAITKASLSFGLVNSPFVLFVSQGNQHSSLALSSQKLKYSLIFKPDIVYSEWERQKILTKPRNKIQAWPAFLEEPAYQISLWNSGSINLPWCWLTLWYQQSFTRSPKKFSSSPKTFGTHFQEETEAIPPQFPHRLQTRKHLRTLLISATATTAAWELL